MFSTELSTIDLIFLLSCLGTTLALAIASWVNARNAGIRAAKCYEWVHRVSEMRDPTAKIAELSTELTELTDAYDSLLKSHKKLRARITMREHRAKKVDGTDPDDLGSISDKRQLRLAAKNAGLLK